MKLPAAPRKVFEQPEPWPTDGSRFVEHLHAESGRYVRRAWFGVGKPLGPAQTCIGHGAGAIALALGVPEEDVRVGRPIRLGQRDAQALHTAALATADAGRTTDPGATKRQRRTGK